jgi:hypothetical protein
MDPFGKSSDINNPKASKAGMPSTTKASSAKQLDDEEMTLE